MKQNHYDILYRLPVLEAVQMPHELEALAEQLVASGRLRINADHVRNFVIYSGYGFEKSFSYLECVSPDLLPRTRKIIADNLAGYLGESGVDTVLEQLHQQFRRTGHVPKERQEQIARILLQAVHPAIIRLAIDERADIYVSYSHNVSDLMGVPFWQSYGQSNGLQSTDSVHKSIYISCGGDPFITKEEQKKYVTDGFPALARMMVIAGQEFGHFADLRRDASGAIMGRFSAHFSPFRAAPDVKIAREKDIATVKRWVQQLDQIGAADFVAQEKRVQFYRVHRRYSPLRLMHELRLKNMRQRINKEAQKMRVDIWTQFPQDLPMHPWFGKNILLCLEDMAFNLSPQAEVYRRDNPLEEEAIVCIEALARVPQQVNKWGHLVTHLCLPHLYQIYYGQVIPAAEAALKRLK